MTLDATKMSLPFTLAASLIVSAITGTAAAVVSAYGMRDSVFEHTSRQVDQSILEMRRERAEQMDLYVTKQAFGDWRQQERIRQDQIYYSLLNAIERLSGRIKH